MSPGVVDAVNAGHSMLPLIATPVASRAASAAYYQAQSATYAFVYRTQPAVRKVIDYIARNAAQLPLRCFERIDESTTEEDYDHPAAVAMRRPNTFTSPRRFIYSLFADYLIYENAYALKLRPGAGAPLTLVRVPVAAMEVNAPSTFYADSYRVHFKDGSFREVPGGDVIHFRGYDPSDPMMGVSRLETLRAILTEEATNQAANVERLRHGGLGGGYIKRPLEAPDWPEAVRQRFEEEWKQRSSKSGDDGIPAPVLEEGMEFVESSVTPKDAEMLRGRQFTRAEVASLYGLPADLVEASLDGEAADREEARRQFYADTLPPIIAPIGEDLDLQLLQAEYGADEHHFEFSTADKLRGDTEARLKALVSAAGGPILTRNEARETENRKPLDGGDELITPMNVTVGGKPSPAVMPVQDPGGPSQEGDEREASRPSAAIMLARHEAQVRRRDDYAGAHTKLLRRHFTRQEKAYRSAGSFDEDRWNAELGDDLEAEARRTVEHEGSVVAERLMSTFDLDRCADYLREGAEQRAQAINATTRNDLEADAGGARADEGDDEDRTAFDRAKNERADQAGVAIATSLAGFGSLEAARQTPKPAVRVKTWIVTSGASRHPQLAGETVPVFSAFSNGGQYPGDPTLGPAETARCQCLIEIT